MAILDKIQIHPLVSTEDLPTLPEQLQIDFAIYRLLLARNPQKPRLPGHNLTGELLGYRVLEVEWEGDLNAYRLIYHIYDKPAPRRVLIVSFAEHDSAYSKAKARSAKKI